MISEKQTTKAGLLHAQEITIQLFGTVEKNGLIVPGKSEKQLSDEIIELALTQFGITDHWHKKIVRTGPNTLATYSENPPDRIIQPDDILFLDFGPIVGGFEADLGRTYVLGDDPLKWKLKQDVEKAWYEIRNWYSQHSALVVSDFYQYILETAANYGWTFTGEIAGHILGKYPHEQPADPKSLELDIHPTNNNDIFLTDANGDKRHWCLELQFIDREKEIGGYFEQLL
jgi:hypothetical protein